MPVAQPRNGLSRMRLRIRDYSDDELRNIELETAAPLELGGVVHRAPPTDALLTFVSQYTSEEDLICAFGHHHKSGFVLEDAQGARYLIGRDCAHTRYGIEWDTFLGDVERQVGRKKSLRWLHKVSSDILAAGPQLRSLISCPEVRAFDSLRKQLLSLPSPISDALQELGRRYDRSLYGTYMVRDLQKERLRKEKARQDWARVSNEKSARYERELAKAALIESEKPYLIETTREVLRFPCKALVKTGMRMEPRIRSLVDRLLGTATNLASSTQFNHPDLVAKGITTTATNLDNVLAEVNEACEMFAPEMLDRMCEWLTAEEFRGVKAKRIAEGFEVDCRGEVRTVRKPEGLKPILDRVADRYRH